MNQTPTQRIKSTIKHLQEKRDNLHSIRGYLAVDLSCEVITLDDFNDEMNRLFWEDKELQEVINMLEGKSV